MKKFSIIKNINGVKLVKYFNSKDTRGNFSKIFTSDFFYSQGFKKKISQVNISTNIKKGTVRGFHYQKKPRNEQKIVICNKGSILDVVIDLRKKSKYYLKTYKFLLSENKNNCLFIPAGFAHGFQSLKNNTQIIYFHSELYYKKLDTGVNPLHNKFDFTWPIKVTEISKRDRSLPIINNSFKGI